MGYYSTFDYEITESTKLDLQKAKELEKFFGEENDDVYGFQEVELELNSSGELVSIELADYYAKFYDSELFAKKLSECIIEGKVFLFFTGEDGEKWGYKVTSNQIERMYSKWLTESEDELFHIFLENKEDFLKWLDLKQKSTKKVMEQIKNKTKTNQEKYVFKKL